MNIGFYLLLGFLPLLFAQQRCGRLIVWLNIIYLLPLLLESLSLSSFFTTTPLVWANVLDISWSFHFDGLAKLFLVLISGIGILIFAYSLSYYYHSIQKLQRLNVYLQLFTVSMIALILADNLIVLFTAWELTTLTSFLLIQFYYHDEAARKAAFQGMLVTVMGGLALLCGFIILQQIFASWSLQYILKHFSESTNANYLSAAFFLILLGCMTKSAQVPFYFWLPGAMKAPTPVSAFLHSATMVNAGVYLLCRLHSAFATNSYWYSSLAIIGLTTMLIASVLALIPKDLKAILAYTTVFSLGSMFYLLAGNHFEIAEGLVLFLFVHAAYKALLFMTVGAIDKHYQTRDLEKLAGIARQSLPLALVIIVGTMSMAGLPPFFGFFAKELVFEAKLAGETLSWPMMILSFLTSMFIATASFKIFFTLFKKTAVTIKPKTSLMPYAYAVPLVLAVITIIIDFIPFDLEKQLLEPAASALMPIRMSIQTMPVVWRDWPVAFSLSLLTVSGGSLFYWFKKPLIQQLQRMQFFSYIEPGYLLDKSINNILNLSQYLTAITQMQSLRRHIIMSLVTLIIIVGLGSSASIKDLPLLFTLPKQDTLLFLTVLFIASGISLVVNKTFINSLISLSVFGIALTLFFILQGAPDVAMTQLLIEILTVIIIAVALRQQKISYQSEPQSIHKQIVLWSLAIGVGAIITCLLVIVLTQPFSEEINNYFIQHSLSHAYGKNVVNVVLVDFRALDTLGESLVIAAAAIGIATLAKLMTSRSN